MMQSPNSDSGQPASPPSSSPNSPANHNNSSNNSTPSNLSSLCETKFIKTELKSLNSRYQELSEDGQKEMKSKLSLLTNLNKENTTTTSVRNSLDQILYPKSSERDLLETSAKFSIERLKQLADHRLSPSNIENNSLTNNKIFSIDHSVKHNGSASTTSAQTTPTTSSSDMHQLIQSQLGQHMQNTHHTFSQHANHHHLNNILNSNHFNSIKYGINGINGHSPSELDIERLKLARTLSNGKELSDFGFRIQLGGLTTNYAHSETSEELNVDGNEESSQDAHSVSSTKDILLFIPKY